MKLQQHFREIRYADHLPDITLVVIGLWNMGYTDLDEVAHLLWMVDQKPLRQLYKMLKTSRNPLIRRFVDVGLPPGVYRPLPEPTGPTHELSHAHRVTCPLCHFLVDCVPCPRCSLKTPPAETFPFRNRGRVPPLPQHRTAVAPGSACKIEILRQRVANGERLFHYNDRRIPRNGKP